MLEIHLGDQLKGFNNQLISEDERREVIRMSLRVLAYASGG